METNHPRLGVARQCRLLGLCRSTFYYKTFGEAPKNSALMKRLDEIFLDAPFFGARQMARMLCREGVRISMDGRGRWMDNVMVERLWRSLKYENVSLNAYEMGIEAKKGCRSVEGWGPPLNSRAGPPRARP